MLTNTQQSFTHTEAINISTFCLPMIHFENLIWLFFMLWDRFFKTKLRNTFCKTVDSGEIYRNEFHGKLHFLIDISRCPFDGSTIFHWEEIFVSWHFVPKFDVLRLGNFCWFQIWELFTVIYNNCYGYGKYNRPLHNSEYTQNQDLRLMKTK